LEIGSWEFQQALLLLLLLLLFLQRVFPFARDRFVSIGRRADRNVPLTPV
jgi:hypothetical protein